MAASFWKGCQVQYCSDAKYNKFACETCLPPCANVFIIACECVCLLVHRMRTRSLVHVNAVATMLDKNQTRSHEESNAFAHDSECAGMRWQMHMQNYANAFVRGGERAFVLPHF